jgi:hypothetical protein
LLLDVTGRSIRRAGTAATASRLARLVAAFGAALSLASLPVAGLATSASDDRVASASARPSTAAMNAVLNLTKTLP